MTVCVKVLVNCTHTIGGKMGGGLFSGKAVNIINTYTFILGAEYFSPPACFLHHCTQLQQLVHTNLDARVTILQADLIGACLSEPHIHEFAVEFLYIYISYVVP